MPALSMRKAPLDFNIKELLLSPSLRHTTCPKSMWLRLHISYDTKPTPPKNNVAATAKTTLKNLFTL